MQWTTSAATIIPARKLGVLFRRPKETMNSKIQLRRHNHRSEPSWSTPSLMPWGSLPPGMAAGIAAESKGDLIKLAFACA